MANENFKNALDNAGVTVEQFAEIIEVDPKSVQRWVAGTTVPYPRNRAAIARALDTTAAQLWPEEARTPSRDAADLDPDAVTEVVGSWGEETDPGAPDPVALISQAHGRVDVYDGTYVVRRMPGLVEELRRRGDDGCDVRVLSDAPTRVLERVLGHEHIELRFGGGGGYLLVRAADVMLVTFDLSAEGARAQPVMRLQRRVDGGMFDRLAGNFDAGWANPDAVITNRAELAVHLSNAEEELHADWEAPTPGVPAPQADHPSQPSAEPPAAPPAERPASGRRWPRRPH